MPLKGNIIDDFINSTFLKEQVHFMTYLPNNYSPLYTYKLLLVSDGEDYMQQGKLATVVDKLLNDSEIKNVIIVMIPYNSIEDRYDKYHPKGKKHDQYIRFLAEELLPYLENKYHTYELAKGRTLLGDSLAGTACLHAASQYPYTFGQVIAQSPYIHNLTLEAFHAFNKPEQLRIYQEIGTQETNVVTTKGEKRDFLTTNREFYKLLKEKGIEVYYHEFNGEHSWAFWQQNIINAIITMLK